MRKLVIESLNERKRHRDSEGHRLGSKRSHYDKDGFVKNRWKRSGKENPDYDHWERLRRVIIINDRGDRVAIDREDLERLESGKDVTGNSLKYGGQEEWIIADSNWRLEESVNEKLSPAPELNVYDAVDQVEELIEGLLKDMNYDQREMFLQILSNSTHDMYVDNDRDEVDY
jgi:hypothetical protein